MRFRDTRPSPQDGSEDKRTAAQIMAAAFAGGGAVRLPAGFGRKRGSPMHLRFQAAVRHGLNVARLEKAVAAGKGWAKRIQERLDAEEAAS